MVEAEGEPWLVDVGYALPAPVPVPPSGAVRVATPFYDIEVQRGAGNQLALFTEDDRGRRFRYQASLAGAASDTYMRAWADTFRLEAPYMRRLALGRFRGRVRYLYKASGVVYAITRRGEKTVPLSGRPPRSLASFFDLPEPLMSAAVGALGRLAGLRQNPSS